MLTQDQLNAFEKGLNPRRPEQSVIAAKIVGFGEISAIFEIAADAVNVYKRLPLFETAAAARQYQQMFLAYCRLLAAAGLCLPAHDTCIVAVAGRPVALYIAQRKMAIERFGHRLIHRLDRDAALDLIGAALGEMVKVWDFNASHGPAVQLAIDGQLSNWVRGAVPDNRLYYIDTSTPLFCRDGIEQQNPELLLKSAPAFLRWVIRMFFLKDVMTRYYRPRQVMTDLIANLHKEGRPGLIDPAIAIANRYLPLDQPPLTRSEVDHYYREDKVIWTVFLGLRRLDRFLTTRLVRRRYEFILPGRIRR